MIGKFASALAVVSVMLFGVIGLGRLAASDIQAMVMTTVFFVLVAAGIGFLVWRRRDLAVALITPFLVVGALAGVWLGLPLVTDATVDEQVVVAVAPSGPSASDDAEQAEPEPALLASGEFKPAAHPGRGVASLISVGEGAGVVTLTDFSTDNGPDLLVYLVPAESPAGSTEGAVPLGDLKGNKGDQQYDVPAGTELEDDWRVVVWCRAFAVSFTEATLSA